MKKIISVALVGILSCLPLLGSEILQIIAHRGASQAAPENTIPAFELAWQLDADAIEGDFYLTQDGEGQAGEIEEICSCLKSTPRRTQQS